MNSSTENSGVEAARARWLEASHAASKLTAELFQPGDGYGDPDARASDDHRLESARLDSERLFREYHDLDRREMELKMLELQRSQRLATWASFAAVSGKAIIPRGGNRKIPTHHWKGASDGHGEATDDGAGSGPN